MTASQDRRNSDSPSLRERSERPTGSRRITAGQEKFLRKLLVVLSEIVDEKGGFDDNDNNLHAPASKDIHYERRTEAAKPETIPLQATRKGEEVAPTDGTATSQPRNLIRFLKLCEVHDQLSQQIRSSLGAVGGRRRTAAALTRMQQNLGLAYCSCSSSSPDSVLLFPEVTIKGLDALYETIPEVAAAFKELGVFNAKFFDTLDLLQFQAKEVSHRLDSEYHFTGSGHNNPSCYVDEYLDSLFRGLVGDLDAFIEELTKIAEKEIESIRQSQDFFSQRYLNLTTIATFLSSVTATTLQITADGSDSVLSAATNSLWVISLVFSTASAVYSLLIVAWRRAAIRSPDLCLPRFARDWLRNGPLYSLVTALATFSIGLCFLAFLVIDRQGSVAAAAVPVAFAGFHAYAICILSAWFVFEHWKARNTETWEKTRYSLFKAAAESVWKMSDMVRHCKSGLRRKFMSLGESFWQAGQRIARFTGNRNGNDNVENGPSFTLNDMISGIGLEQIEQQEDRHLVSPEVSGRGTWFTVPDTSVPDDLKRDDALLESRLFNRTLQFTSDCSLLASALSNFVTIYDVDRSFEVMATVEVSSDGHPVKQVVWEPNKNWSNPHHLRKMHRETLLVRSSAGISIHELYGLVGMLHWDILGRFETSVEHARWILPEDADFSGFSCLVGTSLKVFDKTCKELRSWDLSWIPNTGDILDAALFRGRYILCLTKTQNGMHGETQLLLIDRDEMLVVSQRETLAGQSTLTISSVTSNVIIHGGEDWQAFMELPPDEPDFLLHGLHPNFRAVVMKGKERSLTLCGNHDSIFVGYLKGEIFVRHYYKDGYSYSRIHTITTTDTRALVQDPVSIAVGLHPSRSFPYLFAFSGADGTVVIWSILSNNILSGNKSAESFEVCDDRGTMQPISTGKFLVLPMQTDSQSVEPGFIQEEESGSVQ